jgi:PAS domain S-box-containing protein
MSPEQSSSREKIGTEEVLRFLVDAIEDYAVCMLDEGGRVETWNAGAERICGYAAHEILGKHCSVFYGDTDLGSPRCQHALEHAKRTGKFTGEGWHVRKDGTKFWASILVRCLRDEDGGVRGFAHLTRDLSERRLAEERRRADEERFQLLVTSVRDYAIFMLDPSGRVATWNAGAERFKGYTASEIVGQHFSVFYPPEAVEEGKTERLLQAAQRDGRVEDEGWRVRKDGSRFWANVVITALRDADGVLVGYGKVTRDLTERHRTEELLHQAEERYRRLIDSVRDYAIFILDPSGHIVTWNVGAERIKGYRPEEIIGSHFSRFYPEADVRAGKCEMELEGAARDGRFEDEGWRIRKDGSRFWANVIISAIRDDAGRLVGFSKVTRDLTERRRTEEERSARLAAEEANRTKDQFLAMLGHELRNPLAPIVSALQLLKLRGGTRAARELDVIERQVRHLTRLVDDLLDVSRIAQGRIELKRRSIDLHQALARVVEIATPLFESRGQHFELTSPQGPLLVQVDEGRLVQIFANLLNNASKYTQRGGHIALLVRGEPQRIAIEVRDDGRGIDPALLPRVFDLFVQGYQDSARAEGGLGLGLTLVKQLVQLHGGEVEAQSAGPGLGSSFIVRLPYERAGAG